MAKFITKNQLIGDIGEQLVGYILSSKLNVIYRSISKRDTGIDGEIELTKDLTILNMKQQELSLRFK